MKPAALGFASGAAWGAMAGWLAAAALALFFGLAASASAAFVWGGGAAGALAALSPRLRDSQWKLALTAAAAIFALSGGNPFGLSPEESWKPQLAGTAAFAFGWAAALAAALAPLSGGAFNRRRAELCVIAALRGVGFVVFGILIAAPFYVLVMTSFKSQQALLLDPLNLIPDFGDGLFRAYVELFRDFNFGRYMLISGAVSTVTVIITMLFAAPGAYAVARLRFAGQAAVMRALLLVYLVPAVVLVIPLYVVFSKMGLRDTLLGLVLVYPATTLPVAIYMLQGYFRGIPYELEDAAQMDGCTRMGVIARVTLPLSAPALASAGLYVFMIAWNEFLFAFMFLDDPDIFTLSRGVVALNSSEVPRQHLMAGAVVSTLPVLAIFLWAERFLVGGLAAGGVKG